MKKIIITILLGILMSIIPIRLFSQVDKCEQAGTDVQKDLDAIVNLRLTKTDDSPEITKIANHALMLIDKACFQGSQYSDDKGNPKFPEPKYDPAPGEGFGGVGWNPDLNKPNNK